MPEISIGSLYGQNIIEEGGVATQEFFTWLDQITTAVNNIRPLTGTGSPEGVETASEGRWYVDKNASPADIYFKETGDGNTGWIITS